MTCTEMERQWMYALMAEPDQKTGGSDLGHIGEKKKAEELLNNE